jgi:DNA-binding response OmpR family regulator
MDSPLNIIVIEDHDDLRLTTVESLLRQGHCVVGVACAEALDDELGSFPADVLLLDLNLPGEDGISLSKRLRAAFPALGIIMITARDQASDITNGYGSGADIYLTKPTSLEQISAALNSLSRRLRSSPSIEPGFKIDSVTLQLVGPKATVDLSEQEYLLLAALAKAKDHRLDTWQLLESTGRAPSDASKSSLEVQLVRVRKKLELAGANSPSIKSIRGSGYQLCISVIVTKSEN